MFQYKFRTMVKICAASVQVYDIKLKKFHYVFHMRHFFNVEKSYSKKTKSMILKSMNGFVDL